MTKTSLNHHKPLKTTKVSIAQPGNLISTKFRRKKQRHSNDSSKFLLRPHRLSFRNHHRWIPYAICRDEIAICRETGFHHLSSKQKKTRNPQPTSLRLRSTLEVQSTKTKWLGLKKGWSVDSGLQWAKFGLLGLAGPNLDGQYLTKSFLALWKQSNMKRISFSSVSGCVSTPQRIITGNNIMWANSISTKPSHVVSNPRLWEIKILHVADVFAKIVVGNNLHVASWREHPSHCASLDYQGWRRCEGLQMQFAKHLKQNSIWVVCWISTPLKNMN